MKRLSSRLIITILGAAAGAIFLNSCHTVAGVGADVQDAGRCIQRSVNRAR